MAARWWRVQNPADDEVSYYRFNTADEAAQEFISEYDPAVATPPARESLIVTDDTDDEDVI